MDGVSWSSTRAQESFSRPATAADTLSRLASFIARAEAKQHTRAQKQQTSQVFICQECGKTFSYATDLLNHQEVKHALPKPHRCPSCGQEFSLRSSLQLHRCDSTWCELCHRVPRLASPCPACTTCTSDSSRPKDKLPHRQPPLLDGSPYACALCGRGFNQKQALLHHQQAGCSEPPSPSETTDAGSHPDDSPPVSEGDSTRSECSDMPGPSSSCRSVSECHFCSRTFRTEAALQRHNHTNHADELQKTEGDDTDREMRKRRNEDPNRRPESKPKLLNCRSCDKVFRSTTKLYVHRKEKHSREKDIRREPRPAGSKHRRTGVYPCQVCGKVFFHHLSLRAHYRHHTASCFTAFRSKDSTLSENRPNKVISSLADNKTVRAGPGRPRKFPRVKSKMGDPGRCREVPEQKEEEEMVEEEFPCPSCAEVFPLQWQLKEHMELHQSSLRRRQCSVCTNEMDSCKGPGSRRQRLYHCVPCQQGFSALDPFLEHCQAHLRVRVEEDSVTEGHTHQASKA